tara:strand:- start:14562 stop:15089 length:528 start_codon:yes stop_codon:yes gene_type:complete
MDLKNFIRTVPDYPKPGILFRDITTLLYNGEALKYITNEYYQRYKNKNINGIAAIEARGFIFGSLLAEKLGISFIPLRKKDKLPCKVISEEYDLEYGKDTLEIDCTAINEKDNIVIIDDLIATGGTAIAAGNLILRLKGKIHEYCFLINLPDLDGEKKLKNMGYKTFSLVSYSGK